MNTSLQPGLCRRALLAASLLAVLLPAPAWATPPARAVAIVNWPALRAAAAAAFKPADVIRFERAMKAQFRARVRLMKEVPKPYVGLGRRGYGAVVAIKVLVTPYLTREKIASVEAFFRKINRKKMLRGRVASRDFSGCTVIRYALDLKSSPEIGVVFRHIAAPSATCSVYRRPGYSGPGSWSGGRSGTGVPVASVRR